MRRGDIVTVALQGDFGKPRPALVVQSDLFEGTATVTVLLMTSSLADAPLIRLAIAPTPANGLSRPTQIMIDKAMTIRRERVGQMIGRASDDTMTAVGRSLALFLGFG